MARTKRNRIYWRSRGGVEPRAYVDLRDLGGGREPLVAPGEKRATTDPDVAAKLAADRVAEMTRDRREGVLLGLKRRATLGEYATEHLRQKALTDVAAETIVTAELSLERAKTFLGEDKYLDAIRVSDVREFAEHLATLPSGRKDAGGTELTLTPGTVRHVLNDLSNLYQRAQSDEVVAPGYNPVAAWSEKPSAAKREARWLEPHDVALLLEAARLWTPPYRADFTAPLFHALLSTLALTGGRFSEVAGLLVTDVRFDRRTVTIRPNEHRRLKTAGSHRVVPLWPQLRGTLRDYLFSRGKPEGGLLFPSPRNAGMIKDIRKALDTVALTAGWQPGEVRPHMFRHSYAAARLQTLDNGAPVSTYTVSRELGHRSERLVREVYAHLGEIRHRSEVVEFRFEQYKDVLGYRLEALRT